MMQCSHCQSNQTVKNGRRNGKQSYLCRSCDRQFRETYTFQGYPPEVKEHCLKLYLNGMGFRAIERVTGVCHNTVLNWVKLADQALPDEDYEIPESTQVDELQTFVGSKKSKSGNGIAVNSKAPGILKWVVGGRSLATFRLLWLMIQGWGSFLYITDGYPVYPCLINDCDHLVSKTAMTRVEGENSRLRHKKSAIASQDMSAIPSQLRCWKHRFVC